MMSNETTEKINENPDTIIFSQKKAIVRVQCEDIVFFESLGHYILVHMQNGEIYRTRSTIPALLEKTGKRLFVRVHRGFVVNLKYVHRIDTSEVYLHSFWKEVPLSRTYRQELANALIDFNERKILL